MPAPKVVHLSSAPQATSTDFASSAHVGRRGLRGSVVMQRDRDETADGVGSAATPRARNRLEPYPPARRVVETRCRQKAQIYRLHDPELLFWWLP